MRKPRLREANEVSKVIHPAKGRDKSHIWSWLFAPTSDCLCKVKGVDQIIPRIFSQGLAQIKCLINALSLYLLALTFWDSMV